MVAVVVNVMHGGAGGNEEGDVGSGDIEGSGVFDGDGDSAGVGNVGSVDVFVLALNVMHDNAKNSANERRSGGVAAVKGIKAFAVAVTLSGVGVEGAGCVDKAGSVVEVAAATVSISIVFIKTWGQQCVNSVGGAGSSVIEVEGKDDIGCYESTLLAVAIIAVVSVAVQDVSLLLLLVLLPSSQVEPSLLLNVFLPRLYMHLLSSVLVAAALVRRLEA